MGGSMLQIRKILHPTDFSPSAEAAFTQAVTLARRYGAELHLLHTVASFGPSIVLDVEDALADSDLYYRQLWTAADHQMQEMVTKHDAADIPHRRLHARGLLPAPVILEHAQDSAVDLIVVGPYGHHYHPHALGSVVAEVLRGAPCPVLITQHPSAFPPAPHPMQILLPVDISQPTEDMLRITASLAQKFNAEIDMLHVVDPALHVGGLDSDTLRTAEAPLGHQLRTRMNQLPEGDDATSRVRFHTLQGLPSQEILKFARTHHSDLIVIASPALSRTKYFPAGSLTEHIASAAPCPVFVIRTPSRVTPRPPARITSQRRQTPILPPGVAPHPTTTSHTLPA